MQHLLAQNSEAEEDFHSEISVCVFGGRKQRLELDV